MYLQKHNISQIVYTKFSEMFIVNSENGAVNRPSGTSVEQTFVSVVRVLFPGTVLLLWTVVDVVTCKRKYQYFNYTFN